MLPFLRVAPALLVGALTLGSLAPSVARADEMDIALSRVSTANPNLDMELGCDGEARDVLPTRCPNQEDWARLMSQLGFALMPPVLSPARTTGYGGLYVGVEGWVSPLNETADWWETGTEGERPSDARNRFVDPVLFVSRVNIRKGFPFGFELGTSFGYVANTSMWVWGLELKWALLEGFRTGIGILPDVAVRGMVNTMVGDSEFNLTVPSVDVVVSKPIPVAGTATLTPFVSGQLAWIFADSELVDLTPNVNAFDACRPFVEDPDGGGAGMRGDCMADGTDYANNAVFDQLRMTRWRLALGLQGRFRALTMSASFAFDLQKPGEADTEAPDDLPRQWNVALAAGLTL